MDTSLDLEPKKAIVIGPLRYIARIGDFRILVVKASLRSPATVVVLVNMIHYSDIV